MALNLRETIQSLIQSLIEQNNETNYCNMAYRDGTLGSHDWKIIFLGISDNVRNVRVSFFINRYIIGPHFYLLFIHVINAVLLWFACLFASLTSNLIPLLSFKTEEYHSFYYNGQFPFTKLNCIVLGTLQTYFLGTKHGEILHHSILM